MHHQTVPVQLAGLLRWAMVTLVSLGFGLASGFAQSTTGSISGHVISETSKTALQGARVAIVGTNLEAFTNASGDYHLSAVAPGDVSVSFTFEGYPPLTVPAKVAPGQTAKVDAQFHDDVVMLNEFKISGDVIGTARAVNQERAAPAFTNIIASDAIGQLPDKNAAEALQRVPGVDIARDKGEGRYINIRGLDPVYVGVSMNGIRMSTAEKGTREVALDVFSSTFLGSLVVNKVNTPDMDTDDMGGSVDLRTRSGFDQDGRQIMVQVGTNYGHQEDRHGGYNTAINYSDQFFGGQAAAAVDLAAEARPFTAYTEPATTWARVLSPTDGQEHWILNSQDFRQYDAERWRQGISTGLDFKLNDTTKLYVRFLDSNYTEANQQYLTTFPFSTATNSTTVPSGVTALTDQSATVSIKAGGIIKSMAQIKNNKRVSSLVGGADTVSGPWTNNLGVGYTTGKYTRPTATIAFANSTATVVSYAFNGPYNNTVQQVSGPSLDSPSSYAFSTKSAYSNTTANMHEETVKDSLRYDLPDAPQPTFVKGGVEYRAKDNNIDTSKWGITSVPYTLAQVATGNDTQDTMGGFPNFQINQSAVHQFYTNQSAFPTTLTASTTYGGAFKASEDIAAAFAEAGVTVGKLKLIAGFRAENTEFHDAGWQIESTTAGATVITPDATNNNYTKVLPSFIAEYEIDPQTIARASWTNTIARPDYSATAPGRTVDDVNHLVTTGNPRLNALTASNWDLSLEHYYSPLGLVSLAAYYKSIRNFTYNAQSGVDPSTGYLLTTYFNGPSAYIYGLEGNWAQQLSFLPGPLKGLGLLVNGLYGSSEAKYPTRPGETLPFAGFAHLSGNVALTYSYAGFSARLAEHFHSKRLESGSVIGVDATQDQYEAKYETVDASLSYLFRQHWEIYVLGANLNNAPLKEYYGGTGNLVRLQTYEAYGWSAESGIRWTY